MKSSALSAPVLASPELSVRYEQILRARGWSRDPAQCKVINALQELMDQLIAREQSAQRWRVKCQSLFQRRVFGQTRYEPVQGLYVWGGVGRGKTFLMDLFFEFCPIQAKRRDHFHRFMRDIHAALVEHQGRPDPLQEVAESIARSTSVLCFDEFFVKDIGDAMILGNLFSALFERGVCLVATSNVPPSRLYESGLQRDRFLPAIALLERCTHVLQVSDGHDFRLQTLTRAPLFMSPCNDQVEAQLAGMFEALSPETIRYNVQIEVVGRQITARALSDDVVWFDFDVLCLGPRSVRDYIEVAEDFTTVFLTGLPAFGAHNEDAARRFMYLVDEFYDRHVKLIISSDVPIASLYPATAGSLAFEFERTISRLYEMQSRGYLGQAHSCGEAQSVNI
ncbi:MAG: cell division protein ZapE [Gammaproteobacteria bacterium]